MNALKTVLFFLTITSSLITTTCANAASITIGVASNFTLPMKSLVQLYQSEHANGQIRLAFSSSGKLYAQIQNGAPFHAMFSADQRIPSQLITDNKASKQSYLTYAVGQLALWSRHQQPQPLIDMLHQQRFQKLAIANPKLAPYGLAAKQTLQSLNLYSKVSPFIVKGENISQAYQFVYSGNAELGFVALSQIKNYTALDNRSLWIVPSDLHQPIRQGAVILNTGSPEQRSLAEDFFRFIQSPQASAVIQQFGYIVEKTDDNRI